MNRKVRIDDLPAPPYLTSQHPARARYRKPERLLSDPDAVVIGSGIGGMGIASILAQRKGWRVLLLEGNAVPGGCTHCHEIEGFEFPSGIDSIGDMDASVGRGLYRPTIDYLTGGRLQWAKMPDVHEICCFGFDPEDSYEWYSDHRKNIAWIQERFGFDTTAYYDLEERIEWWAWAWAVTKLLPEWIPLGLRDAFYSVFGGAWRKYMGRRVTEVFVDELGFSDKLASVFSYMYGNHGRTPDLAPFAFHAVNLFHYRYGAYFPVGGPGQMAECIVPIIEAAGGQLAVGSRVSQILVEGNTAVGVELDDGQQIRAPVVISDASAYTTLIELLPEEVSQRHGYPAKFDQIRPSVAHVYLLLGYDEAIDLPKQIIWHIPSYDLVNDDRRYKQDLAFDECGGGYLLSPSARDPSHSERYPDKSTVVVLAEAPYRWVEQCRADPAFKAKFEADVTRYMTRIVHHHMPILKDKTPVLQRAGVPMGCNPWAWEGCSLGLEPSGARFVEHTHWLRPQTKVNNLYLTGQDAFSAGFCGSMLGARLCYSAMTGDWMFMLRKRP